MNFMNKLAGNEYVGFSNATYVQRHNPLRVYYAGIFALRLLSELTGYKCALMSQVSVGARVGRQKLCHRLLLEGKEGERQLLHPLAAVLPSLCTNWSPWHSFFYSVSQRAPTWLPFSTSTSRYILMPVALLSAVHTVSVCLSGCISISRASVHFPMTHHPPKEW